MPIKRKKRPLGRKYKSRQNIKRNRPASPIDSANAVEILLAMGANPTAAEDEDDPTSLAMTSLVHAIEGIDVSYLKDALHAVLMLYRDGNLVNKNAPTVMTNDATVRTGAVASATVSIDASASAPASALGVCASCAAFASSAAAAVASASTSASTLAYASASTLASTSASTLVSAAGASCAAVGDATGGVGLAGGAITIGSGIDSGHSSGAPMTTTPTATRRMPMTMTPTATRRMLPPIPETPIATRLALTTTPPTPMLNRNTRVSDEELIMLNENAFGIRKNGTPRQNGRGSAGIKQLSRAVHNIIESILNLNLTEEQQVYSLRKASTHPRVRKFFKSAGLIDSDEYETLKYLADQMKQILNIATSTEKSKGRANDDKRSVVQSVLLSIATTPSRDGENQNNRKIPSMAARLRLVGMKGSAAYDAMNKAAKKRLAIREGTEISDWSSVKSRKGFWTKVSVQLRAKILSWIYSHHHVIHSPIARDTLWVTDPNNPGGDKIRKNKLLLQCSVRELHSDLYKPTGIGLGDLVRDENGKPLISDTVFRALIPPELRAMSGAYKIMCCCAICQSFDYKQNALNRFRMHLLNDLRSECEDMPVTNQQERYEKSLELAKISTYQRDAFDGSDPLHPRGRDATACIQCSPPEGFAATGITRMRCAAGFCNHCGIRKYPCLLAETQSSKVIRWYDYQKLPTCSHCGALPDGTIECTHCPIKKRKPLSNRNHLALQEKSFPDFWEEYSLSLSTFTMHRFKMLVLGKTHTTDVRRNSLRKNEFALQHDFTEALGIKHNNEIQSSHFGNGLTVSIEGYTCHYRSTGADSPLKCDFHSYMSDDGTQNSATVYAHMTELLKFLVDQNLLTRGGRILSSTDGAAKQYKSATSIYFMSMLSQVFGVVVDRAIACPGHGKNPVWMLSNFVFILLFLTISTSLSSYHPIENRKESSGCNQWS